MTDEVKDQTPLDSGTPAQPVNTPAATGTEPGKQAGTTTPPEKTFTQADLDNIVRDRLAKEQTAFLKKLGVDNLDVAKTAISKVKEIEEANKTAEQKLQDDLAKATSRAELAETKRRTALIRAAVITEASKPGVVAGDRLEAAYKLLDQSKLTINDNDDVEGVTDAINALLVANPFLKAETPKQPAAPKIPASNPAGTGAAEPDLSWLRSKNPGGSFARGGVRPPSGE